MVAFINTIPSHERTMSELGRSPPSPSTALPDPAESENVLYNPSLSTLRALSTHQEQLTEFGAPAYVSEQRSRAANRTKNAIDDDFNSSDHRLVDAALRYARQHRMVCLDRRVGRHPDLSFTCRYYVPGEQARIALALANLLEPATPQSSPDFLTVQVPDWEDVGIRVFPDAGVTAVLGSDYTGEAKKSFLRLFMYRAKQRGGLGLHAGSKRVTFGAKQEAVGQLFLGLSATGKSTLTAHDLQLSDPDAAWMVQDDVCALLRDGTVAGSEGNGLYVKTIGLDRDEQPALYEAVTHESSILENVEVDPQGSVDFEGDRYTANGRATIRREHLASANEDIDLSTVDQVFFITRHPHMPPVVKLAPHEAAAAFMCGESIETSAGDPSRAGEPVRVVGTNPFIIGDKGEEGNRFLALLQDLDVDAFVLNTGSIGPNGKDITVDDSVTLIRKIARNTVDWHEADSSGYTVPRSVPGMDISEFAVEAYVPDYTSRIEELRRERRRYLEVFDTLNDEIKAGF